MIYYPVLTTLDRFLPPLMWLSLLLWIPFAFAALFTFDAPGSTNNPFNYVFAYGILAYGPAVVATQIVRRRFRRPELSRVRAFIGLVPFAFLLQAGVGLAQIMLVCGGSFDCR